MEKWTDMGHGMRRRMGAPSNHLESATGDAMANRQHNTLGEHYDMAQSSDSARVAMGDSGAEDTASAGQDIDNHMGSSGGAGERHGASYNVTAHTTHLADPSLGPTQAQGRIVRSVLGRQAPNFQQAILDSEM